jgi:ABC-type antimicrobial peptide transport system permease subunit
VGLVLGVGGTWVVGRLVQRLLFDVASLDVTALAGATAIISVVSLTASVIPARRAARIDPLIALAAE